MQEALELSPKQVNAITNIYEKMRIAAVAQGKRFIAAEAKLSKAFADGGLDKTALMQILTESESARAKLRFTHLSAHLATPSILSDKQINSYNVLRGYTNDPCANVPEGHAPDMWKKHNGCE